MRTCILRNVILRYSYLEFNKLRCVQCYRSFPALRSFVTVTQQRLLKTGSSSTTHSYLNRAELKIFVCRSMSSNTLSNQPSPAEAILDFWFGTVGAEEVEELDEAQASQLSSRQRLWFGSSPSTDKEIQERFGELVRKAKNEELSEWQESPRGSLALLILLDQFTRNIFRGSPESFSSDHLALAIAKRAVAQGMDKKVPLHLRMFFYLPFEHSEDLHDQELALKYFGELVSEAPPLLKPLTQGTYDFSKRHKVVIERFGRFPHRNVVLGRPSTPEEEEYLKDGKWF